MAEFWLDKRHQLLSPYSLWDAVDYAKYLAWLSVVERENSIRQMWQLEALTFSILPKYVDLLGV